MNRMPPPFLKRVIFTTRLVPNFLWHMLAVAKIGYDSDYSDKWRHTISEQDLLLLQSHRPLLKFGEGSGGALSAFFAMLPAWLPLETQSDLRNYFTALDRTLQARSLQPIADSFPQADWTDRFLREDLAHWDFPDDTSFLRSASSDIASMYLRHFDRYLTDIWPTALPSLESRARQLQEHFDRTDYIAAWENLLGLTFASPQYEMVVCFANKTGPDFNSLGYSGNLCYYDKPFDKTWQFVSHEIGTHLMIDSLFRLSAEPGIDFRKLYAAFETLAMFFNRRLLKVDQLAYQIPQFDDTRHLELYDRIYRDGISPDQMLRMALESS
jgi:hypothetical protein